MSEIIYAEHDTNEYDGFRDTLLKSMGGHGTYALKGPCQTKIGDGFVIDAINNATYLFVNLYRRNIIGFAAVMHYKDREDPSKSYLYIELICNSPNTPGAHTGTRGVEGINRSGARDMINAIETLGQDLNCSYIKLSAIDEVIPYYWRLGFEFVTTTGAKVSKHIKTKASEAVQRLRKAQLDDAKGEQEAAMVKIIQKYYPNYLSNMYQDMLAQERRDPTGPARDQGIPMIKMMSSAIQNIANEDPIHNEEIEVQNIDINEATGKTSITFCNVLTGACAIVTLTAAAAAKMSGYLGGKKRRTRKSNTKGSKKHNKKFNKTKKVNKKTKRTRKRMKS